MAWPNIETFLSKAKHFACVHDELTACTFEKFNGIIDLRDTMIHAALPSHNPQRSDNMTIRRMSLEGGKLLSVDAVAAIARDCDICTNCTLNAARIKRFARRVNAWYETEGLVGRVLEPISVRKDGVVTVRVAESSTFASGHPSWIHEDERHLLQRPLSGHWTPARGAEAAVTFNELKDGAEAVLPTFRCIVTHAAGEAGYSNPDHIVTFDGEPILLTEVSSNTAMFATRISINLKKDARIMEKAIDRYDGDFGRVLDCCRCSIVADDENGLIRLLDVFQSNNRLSCPKFDIVRLKNRFAQPAFSGYKDAVLNLRVEVNRRGRVGYHICEVQLHAAAILKLSRYSYPLYRFYRRLFSAEDIISKTSMLRNIANRYLQDLDGVNYTQSMAELLRRANMRELEFFSGILGRSFLARADIKKLCDARRLKLWKKKNRWKLLNAPNSKFEKAALELSLASALLDCGDMEGAQSIIGRALALCEATSGMDTTVIYSLIAKCHQECHEYGEAYEYYEKRVLASRTLVARDATQRCAQELNRIKAALDNGKMLGLRLERLYCNWRTRVIAVADLCDDAGLLAHGTGAWTESIKWYTKTLDIRMEALGGAHIDVIKTYESIAKVLLGSGQYSAAKIFFLRAINHKPGSRANTYALLGHAALESGQYDEAKAMLGKSIENDPADAASHYEALIARALLDGDTSEAIQAIEKAINLSYASSTTWQTYSALAHKRLHQGVWDEGRRMLSVLVHNGRYEALSAESAYAHAALEARELDRAMYAFEVIARRMDDDCPSIRMVKVS